jgi:hypothetical protein
MLDMCWKLSRQELSVSWLAIRITVKNPEAMTNIILLQGTLHRMVCRGSMTFSWDERIQTSN